MKNYLYGLLSITLVALPAIVSAQSYTGFANGESEGEQMGPFFRAILGFIDSILIPVVLGLAFLMFIWGVFKYFILGGADSEKQGEGKSLMIYAIAGFVIILSFYGIVNFLTDGLGFRQDTIEVPSVPEGGLRD